MSNRDKVKILETGLESEISPGRFLLKKQSGMQLLYNYNMLTLACYQKSQFAPDAGK